ncbi:MAG: hypothetical protein J7K00_02290 [Candidatus Diapherotrites archaeon]|nr:hypothetical protein [Candidatus Diapherotrites archaeon]
MKNHHEKKYEDLTSDVRSDMEKFENPVYIGSLLFRLAEERASTNLILKELNAKIDQLMLLEERIHELEAQINTVTQNSKTNTSEYSKKAEEARDNTLLVELLPEQDKAILAIARKKGRVEAKEVQMALGYKGTNAACARLNKLSAQFLLTKERFGKKVFYFIPSPQKGVR